MSFHQRLAGTGSPKSLFFLLALLSVLLIGQRLFAQFTEKSKSEAYAKHIEQIIEDRESQRQQLIDNGSLWTGSLHEKSDIIGDAFGKSPSSMMLEGQRRISVDSVPLGRDSQYQLTMELHECNPGSDTCSSGGSFRLTTSDGEPLFSGEIGVLLIDPEQPSYYSLQWDGVAEVLTPNERERLLSEIAGASDRPSAATFLVNLQLAYQFTSHQDGSGKDQALRFWKSVLKAIIADHIQ